MSLRDFCSCTPSEFEAIYETWKELDDRDNKRHWESTRAIVSASISPFMGKAFDIKKIMPFPWDGVGKKKQERKIKESTPERVKELLSHIKDW